MTPIVPDTKNWTWVIDKPCPECGYFVGDLDPEFVPDIIRENALGWKEALSAPDVKIRAREDRWSTLEYGAHVRDVFRIFAERFRLILAEQDPLFANWDQDATAVEQHYDEQDPFVVTQEVLAASEELALLIELIPAGAWTRTGRRSDGTTLTLEDWVRYFTHDPLHHLWDVTGIGRPAN